MYYSLGVFPTVVFPRVFLLLQSFGGLGSDGRNSVVDPGPANTLFTQEPQCPMPTAYLFILVLPHLMCWLISISSPFSREKGGEGTTEGPVLPTIPSF